MKMITLAGILTLMTVATAQGQQKPRVHITDRDAWQEDGGFAATKDAAAGHYSAGIVRQNTELVKTFNKSCPAVTVTANKQNAEYVVIWDHTDWAHTQWTGSQNEFSVYKANGDLLGSGSAHKMPSAAKDICKLIMNDKTPKDVPEEKP